MALIKRSVPPVSREFALELKRRFRPFDVTPGFDRDELMQSVGEQRVINWILHYSSNTIVKSNIDIDTITEKNPEEVILEPESNIPNKKSLMERFTSRFSGA